MVIEGFGEGGRKGGSTVLVTRKKFYLKVLFFLTPPFKALFPKFQIL
jgi:hypothetical protein